MISTQQVKNILQRYQVGLDKFCKRAGNISNNHPSSSKEDVFTLSNQAKEMNFIRDEALKSKDVNSDKIVKLKQQINQGSYQVSAIDIAQKMIERSLVDELVRR